MNNVYLDLTCSRSPRDLEDRFDNPAELLLDAACFDPDDDLQKDRLHQLHAMFNDHKVWLWSGCGAAPAPYVAWLHTCLSTCTRHLVES